ncbi:hypothetical protein O3G_MSEX011539 [Manduca sexta]|uniref:BESS domain-containing protein n=2 Tax=Manduca sexta TaxID=7130 RepID=A0A921ZKZ0_MANSE|nr:hypothetical protein O3G_MSEX011539 [Manduca sexta]
MRDMMRRKLRTRQMKPGSIKRQYKYKYEEEMAFMIPFFKEVGSEQAPPAPEYSEFYQEDGECEVEMPSEVFVDSNVEFEETKPLTFKKRQEEPSREFNDSVYQEPNPTDPLDVFLLTIGTTLRKFSPLYLNQAKSKIFQVVQDYELQQLQNSGNADTSNTNR